MHTQPAQQPTPDYIDAALSYRLESAEFLPSFDLIDTLKSEKPALGPERRRVAEGWMMYAGPDSPLNHVLGMGLHGPVSSAEVDEVEEFYRRRECVCEVIVSPYADMTLAQHLGDRGYRVTEWNSVLFRRLQPGERFDLQGIDIQRVTAADALAWSELVARGFANIPGVSPELFVPFATARNAMCFVANFDGQPAGGAGGSMFPGEGIAALYGASTLPEFRNRGVQNALIQARLRAATEAGCELAVVCTQPGTVSQRNAERNGFRLAYTKVAMQKQV